MSKRSDLLVACMLGNRWRATGYSVGASVSAASPVPRDVTGRVHLEGLFYSIKNDAVSTGLFHTVQFQIRGAGGNTVLAQVDHLVASSTSASVNIQSFGFATPKLGTGLIGAFNTAAGSVSYAINLTGWIEDTNG